jgi:hypothetical protein
MRPKQGEEMPAFGNPFSGLNHDRLLTHEELVRAIRFMIASEYEATQLYEQLAESTDEANAQNVLRDIANEEKVHAGEFLRLLKELQPDEEVFYQQGALESVYHGIIYFPRPCAGSTRGIYSSLADALGMYRRFTRRVKAPRTWRNDDRQQA